MSTFIMLVEKLRHSLQASFKYSFDVFKLCFHLFVYVYVWYPYQDRIEDVKYFHSSICISAMCFDLSPGLGYGRAPLKMCLATLRKYFVILQLYWWLSCSSLHDTVAEIWSNAS